MPRPKKCRKVCCLPINNEFYPADGNKKIVTLTVDEYETIRLIDQKGFSQEECAGFMQVSRPTVQQIYNSARVKLANALVGGNTIRIDGGDYKVCDGKEKRCICCHRYHRCEKN